VLYSNSSENFIVFKQETSVVISFYNRFVDGNKARHNKLQNNCKNLKTLGTQYTGNYVKIY